MKKISVVVPMFNEELIVSELVSRVDKQVVKITNDFEIILIDDGSVDQTWKEISEQSKSNKFVKGIKFSRNFGHHYAITAGLHESQGEWVIVMDGDLQDRPEVIPLLYAEALKGYDIVFVDRKNRPENFIYKLLQKSFYFFLTLMSGIKWNSRQANFSIINREVVDAFKLFPENARFYGSTIKWLGFKFSSVEASHGTRFSGKPSYTIQKRFKLAFDIIISFSERPLRFTVTIGAIISLISISIFIFSIFDIFINGRRSSNYLWIILLLLLILGFLFFTLGIIGIYLGRVFSEVKRRPLYIISEKTEK